MYFIIYLYEMCTCNVYIMCILYNTFYDTFYVAYNIYYVICVIVGCYCTINTSAT